MVPRLVSILAAAAVIAVTFCASVARADAAARSNSIHLLEIDSDDVDDQADALTGALRSRLRASTGWNLVETTQSLSMLTAALRCPRHPDSGCLTRIGDRLKADRFIWGLMNKASGHRVMVELHFWVRGEPDTAATETYSDNLKDPSDDGLRKIAARLLDQLIGAPPVTVSIDAGSAEGNVLVDGEERAQLDQGKASVQVTPGSHEFEIQGPVLNDKKTVKVTGASTVVFGLTPKQPSKVPAGEVSKPFPVAQVLGWGTIGVGALFGVVAGLEAKGWAHANSVNKAYLELVPMGTPIEQACTAGIAGNTQQFVNACPPQRATLNSESKTDSALAWTFGALGAASIATGAVILFVHKVHEDDSQARTTGHVQILPSVSPSSAGVLMSATFE